MKRRKKTDPTARLIEAMLDIALLAGLIRNGVLSSACLLSRGSNDRLSNEHLNRERTP